MSAAATALPQGNHPVPILTEPSESEPGTGNATPRAAVEGEEKKKKRSLFGFGKKKTEEPAKPPPKPSSTASNAPTTTRSKPTSPILTDHARFSPSSPGRSGFASSPRLASPAGSQIFERNVQESTNPIPTSPAIPSHIQTENYIPPVLDASSSAITDDHLNPDTVEIITHASHQPASVAVTAGLSSHPQSPHDTQHHQPQQSPQHHQQPSWADELAAFSAQRFPAAAAGDGASNYGSFDTTDVRRLSFISFADVVQAEQQQQHAFSGTSTSRESMHNMVAGLTSLSAATAAVRSSSPMRSPVSSSPPTSSKDGSVRGLEISVGGGAGAKKPLGSPTSLGGSMALPPLSPVSGVGGGSEIAIETMSQALRRTGSGDLSGGGGGGGGGGGVRSFPTSPI